MQSRKFLSHTLEKTLRIRMWGEKSTNLEGVGVMVEEEGRA